MCAVCEVFGISFQVKARVEADLLRAHREFVLRRQLDATRKALAEVTQQSRASNSNNASNAPQKKAQDEDEGSDKEDPAAKLAAALALLPAAGGCRAHAKRELARLEQLPSQSPEYGPLKVTFPRHSI